jgi:D-alanyl-lipoteichoic acid acyltransferase DltB (MBOAT superfamily)
MISKQEKLNKKYILSFAIVSNILLLAYFKYSDFLISNINSVLKTDIQLLHLLLPLAISFFTFQQIAYLVDCYRGETKEYDFLNYAVFITFFPQLIAGPIVHHKEMMPQFANMKNKLINYKNISMGLFIFSIGLFKKVVIADTFSLWATNGFDVAEKLNIIEAWVTSLSYTFQLYFDFSGYTDMAIGSALLFNIKLPINFNSPYKALNIQDFWRKWHMTLSRFLKDYVYIPLGGNKKSEYRTISNLMATFILGGLWHGAGWTFIFWGFLHGLALVIYKLYTKLKFRLNYIVAWFITFNFINLAWVFFRAKELEDAVKVIKGMFGFSGVILYTKMESYLPFLKKFGVEFNELYSNIGGTSRTTKWMLIGFIITLLFKNSNILLENWKPSNKNIVFTVLLFCIALMNLNKVTEFLYFNF